MPTTASTATRLKAARDAGVEPVGKPLKRHFLALLGSDIISLMPIRIAMKMILSPAGELGLA
jgi:hypothetical protein